MPPVARQRPATGTVAAARAEARVQLAAVKAPVQTAQAVTVGVVLAGIIAALVRFLSRLREQHRVWLTGELGRYSSSVDDIAAVVAEEMRLEGEFARNSADRVAQAMPEALAIADAAQREARVKQILADEERFARQRAEAMAARAINALGRLQLRRDSPMGAYWKLGVASKHTAGCRFMAGKFWPWEVLDRVHPPRHYGCTSSLHGYGDAILSGWMMPSDVPDVRDAVRAASGVMMEQVVAQALLRELDVRDQLLELGVDGEALRSIEMRGV
jgi:hypothetical protein